MKIAYVYDAVYPWVTGGVERRLWELATRLSDDHDVHWYGLRYWEGPAVRTKDGVTLHGVAPERELYVNGRRSIPEALSFATALVEPLRREEFDLIDCQEFPYFPVFSSKIGTLGRETALLVTWHEVWNDYWFEYLGWKGVFGQLVEKLTAAVPDGHIAVSERTRTDVENLGATDVALIPNGIDTTALATIEPANRSFDLLYVGRLIKEKNVDLLLRAVKELAADEPDLSCLIVGEGPERERLRTLADSLGIEDNVSFIGFQDDHETILGLMKCADVFALPSRREGFGMTALEAMACGTPVATIQHPQNAAQELVSHGTTGGVGEPTPSAYANAIRDARAVDSTSCTAIADGYDWDEIIEEVEETYFEAISAT